MTDAKYLEILNFYFSCDEDMSHVFLLILALLLSQSGREKLIEYKFLSLHRFIANSHFNIYIYISSPKYFWVSPQFGFATFLTFVTNEKYIYNALSISVLVCNVV